MRLDCCTGVDFGQKLAKILGLEDRQIFNADIVLRVPAGGLVSIDISFYPTKEEVAAIGREILSYQLIKREN